MGDRLALGLAGLKKRYHSSSPLHSDNLMLQIQVGGVEDLTELCGLFPEQPQGKHLDLSLDYHCQPWMLKALPMAERLGDEDWLSMVLPCSPHLLIWP